MPNTWGRPPRGEIWQDLQALALWIFIIGFVGYILFPNFFKDIYSRLSEPISQTSTLSGDYSLNNINSSTGGANSQGLLSQDFSSVTNALYNNENSEISSGYWVIFVSEGEFKQLALNSDAYAFLLRIIQSDQKAVGQITVILAANGQIQKSTVSEEVLSIIKNMSLIAERSKN